MEFIATVKKISTAVDGGYVVSFDVSGTQTDSMMDMLSLTGKLLNVNVSEKTN